MNPHNLQEAIRSFSKPDPVYLEEVRKGLEAAPYSQVLQVLNARYNTALATDQAREALRQAAIRSVDRGLLKELLETGRTSPLVATTPSAGVPAAAKIQKTEAATESAPQAETGQKSDLLKLHLSDWEHVTLEQVMADIEALRFAKKRFEDTVEEIERSRSTVTVIRRPEPETAPLNREKEKQEKRQEVFSSELTESAKPSFAGLKTGMQQAVNENLINEIKSSRKRIRPESGRQSEQLEIIDQFIKSRSLVIRPPEGPVGRLDLTESQDQYSENVISETLVEILVRQGKKAKAIDVLRKLIWKYPQKKHLFAAQIQELSQ